MIRFHARARVQRDVAGEMFPGASLMYARTPVVAREDSFCAPSILRGS